MLLLVGLILTLGPVLYKTVETFQKILIILGTPLIIFIAINVVDMATLNDLAKGLIGIGEGYRFFPRSEDFPFMAFLAAFAYSGAGGNLMLAQSFYVKEKGYGMGKYAGRITSLITGKTENVDIQGTTFEPQEEEIKKFNKWWKLAGLEHFLAFWGLGLFTMLLLAIIAYATVHNAAGNEEGINFIYNQVRVIEATTNSIVANSLLIVTASMLFATQLAVIDGAGRIVTENIVLMRKKAVNSRTVSKTYYASIWVLLLFGITVILAGMEEPQSLIVLGAVLNAVCMTVFAGILVYTNQRLLPTPAQPVLWRRMVIYACFIILSIFSILVIADNFTPLDITSILSSLY